MEHTTEEKYSNFTINSIHRAVELKKSTDEERAKKTQNSGYNGIELLYPESLFRRFVLKNANSQNLKSIIDGAINVNTLIQNKQHYLLEKNLKLVSERYQCLVLNNDKIPILRKPYLIGINGEIGCGKTTAVDYLSSCYDFTEYMFADPLKRIAVILGFEEKEVFGTQEEKLAINKFWGISGRKFLQVFGSEVCREFLPKILPDMKFNDATLWVRLFEKYYEKNTNVPVAVSDVRFEDESNVIKKAGGYIIRIEREYKSNNEASKHMSELQADKIKPHVVIRNNGTKEDLYRKLNNLIVLINEGFLDITGNIYM
jgi:hypothetical protein